MIWKAIRGKAFQRARAWAAIAALLLSTMAGTSALAAEERPKTKVIVLGVDHSGQLVSEPYRPAVLEAYIAKVRPDAICIERPPEQFARGDHYEFTYEIQYVALPYAARERVALCPFDWIPPIEDQLLGFGLDLETLPSIRPESGYQSFISFPNKASWRRDLFYSEAAAFVASQRAWADKRAEPLARDLPRRMFLYRTFLQARRVAAAAAQHKGKTILVLVGTTHEQDIKDILRSNSEIELVDASQIGAPTAEQIAERERPEYDHAVASFNLLGVQGLGGAVDLPWLNRILARLETQGATPERRLLRLRYRVLTGDLSAKAAAEAYRALADATPETLGFTWNGVKSSARLDSYFDPFGNASVRERAQIELSRELCRSGKLPAAVALSDRIAASMAAAKALQFRAYWPRHVCKASQLQG